MSRARQRQRYLILFLCFCFSSAYGLAALDRTGGRTGIASFQALASAFHDNGPGWALQNFSSLLLMYQRLHASCVVLSSSRQTNRRTRIGAACGSEHLFIFRTCFRIAEVQARGLRGFTIQDMTLHTSSSCTAIFLRVSFVEIKSFPTSCRSIWLVC
jgi:hypothetical protein